MINWKHHVFVFLAHAAFVLMFVHRLNLSVAIIPMVESNTKNQSNTTKETLGEFQWDQAEQGMVLSAFFYGSIPPQIPAGLLVDRYGGLYFYCMLSIF